MSEIDEQDQEPTFPVVKSQPYPVQPDDPAPVEADDVEDLVGKEVAQP